MASKIISNMISVCLGFDSSNLPPLLSAGKPTSCHLLLSFLHCLLRVLLMPSSTTSQTLEKSDKFKSRCNPNHCGGHRNHRRGGRSNHDDHHKSSYYTHGNKQRNFNLIQGAQPNRFFSPYWHYPTWQYWAPLLWAQR